MVFEKRDSLRISAGENFITQEPEFISGTQVKNGRRKEQDMAREWQQTRFKELVMPEGVYYQSLWAVRDLGRMENRVREINRDISKGKAGDCGLVREKRQEFSAVSTSEELVMERNLLETRVRAIRGALEGVPVKYRDIVMENIVDKTPVSKYPDKIWRLWKQRFLFQVAKNLSLM